MTRMQQDAIDRGRRLHNERVAADERAAALAVGNAEPLLNGRCVGHTEYDERYGTVLVIDWHDPAGCEHSKPEPTADGLIDCAFPGCKARFFFVPARQHPTLCLDHADDRSREVDGWTVANSVD